MTQTFGAAVAVARLVELDAEQMLAAFGLAGAFAPLPHEGKIGWEEGRLSWVKDNMAWPAEGGRAGRPPGGRGLPGHPHDPRRRARGSG